MSRTARTPRSTIHDVARAAAVSRQTVSNALNNPHRVKPDTLARVHVEIDRLGYRPSSAAQTLRHQRAGAVGVELNVMGEATSDVAHPFLVELSLAGPAHGCHLVPFASRDVTPMLAGYHDMVRRRLVDAFVIADTHTGDPRPGWLAREQIPYAAFGRVYDDPSVTTWADVDGYAGTSEAVDHLVERGYTRIGYLGWPSGSEVGDERHRGWVEASTRHRLPDAPEATASQALAEATARAERLLDGVGRGGAVVCASDGLALGVLHAGLRRGWTIGRDIGLTGFDGSASARMHGLTTLVQPLDRIADHCLALVHDLLAGGSAPHTGALFTPTLTIGDSTDPTKEGTS
ncbi:MAG: LacI family transcriptional regulator [Actinomycetota bacterium]|nr:LacI family transcriptional regulator [Actinomycetota bacterium]